MEKTGKSKYEAANAKLLKSTPPGTELFAGEDGKMHSGEKPKSKYEAANAKLLKSTPPGTELFAGEDGKIITGYKKGGSVTRADGAAKRGKTKGRTI